MTKDKMKDVLRRINEGTRITKVVATRSVKTGRGDFFAGFSGAWNSVQDDVSGPGADMGLSVDDADIATNGLTLKEARIAHLLVAMQADLAAYDAAFANRAISDQQRKDAQKGIKNNYNLLIANLLGEDATSAPA